ncbi:MAG: PEGA domain-containing protein [Myxococcota bacterium]|nr:PEGA domain-containing protein [Myxococcota bacterium]
MRALFFASLVLVSHVSLTSAARAGNNDVGVVVVGEATMQPQLAAQLEGWLRQHGHQLVSAPLPPDAINTLQDCFVIEDEVCARKVVEKRSKTQAVVFAKVDLKVDASDKTVTLTAYWFDKGRDPIAERRYCERCTDVTLRSTADELMGALTVGNSKDAGKVKITSTPPGARVVIDGNAIGVTPLEYDLKSGAHKVTLSAEGHGDDARDFDVRRGETTQVDVLMKSHASTNFFPFILLGGGGVMLATGLVLFAMDEDEPEPVGTQKEFYRNTGPLGVGLALSGLVVGGIGGYLLFRTKRSSAPVASVTPDSGFVGWAGTF